MRVEDGIPNHNLLLHEVQHTVQKSREKVPEVVSAEPRAVVEATESPNSAQNPGQKTAKHLVPEENS